MVLFLKCQLFSSIEEGRISNLEISTIWLFASVSKSIFVTLYESSMQNVTNENTRETFEHL
jgi:hypothetical protein